MKDRRGNDHIFAERSPGGRWVYESEMISFSNAMASFGAEALRSSRPPFRLEVWRLEGPLGREEKLLVCAYQRDGLADEFTDND